jgi:hypothetical protein
MGSGGVASERDRFWLKHHEAQVASGQDAKAYAALAGVSVCSGDPAVHRVLTAR